MVVEYYKSLMLKIKSDSVWTDVYKRQVYNLLHVIYVLLFVYLNNVMSVSYTHLIYDIVSFGKDTA